MQAADHGLTRALLEPAGRAGSLAGSSPTEDTEQEERGLLCVRMGVRVGVGDGGPETGLIFLQEGGPSRWWCSDSGLRDAGRSSSFCLFYIKGLL